MRSWRLIDGRGFWFLPLAAVVVLCLAPEAMAQEAAPALDPTTGQFPTLVKLFMTNPYINGIILGLSALAVMLFLFFLLTITPGAFVPHGLVDEVTKLVIKRDYEEAARVCRRSRRTFVASILQRCLENASKGHGVIMEVIDSEGRRRADVIWNRISYLSDLSNVAPMLGLLGTVVGMIEAFYQLEWASTSAASSTLSRGIGGAMATTLFGLAVGIMALVFYSIIKAKLTRALADAEQAVHTVADHIQAEDVAK